MILLIIDSVRKDYFDVYAPRIQELAGLTFNQCRSASSWSVPSHASLITGKLPSEHGVHTFSRGYWGLPKEATIFSSKPFRSVNTYGVSSNVYASDAYGFHRFFEQFCSISSNKFDPRGKDMSATHNESALITPINQLIRSFSGNNKKANLINWSKWMQKEATKRLPVENIVDDGAKGSLKAASRQIKTGEEPFFQFINLMDAHVPFSPRKVYDDGLYDVPRSWSTKKWEYWDLVRSRRNVIESKSEYWSRREQLYGASIDYLDRMISDWVRKVLNKTQKETTIIITADHGENLDLPGESGMVNHIASLSEGVLHVPAVIVNPVDNSSESIDEFISHLDFYKLITQSIIGNNIDIGRKVVPAEVMGMGAAPNPPSNSDHWNRTIRSSHRGSVKYVFDSNGDSSIWGINRDKHSYQNGYIRPGKIPKMVKQEFPEDIVNARNRAIDSKSKDPDLDNDIEDRLEDLGYL